MHGCERKRIPNALKHTHKARERGEGFKKPSRYRMQSATIGWQTPPTSYTTILSAYARTTFSINASRPRLFYAMSVAAHGALAFNTSKECSINTDKGDIVQWKADGLIFLAGKLSKKGQFRPCYTWEGLW